MLYELDAAGIPQISQEGVDIINAIQTGALDPETFGPTTPIPSNIETSPGDLMKLFNIRNAPPGLEGV
jgi:hypothetical protein